MERGKYRTTLSVLGWGALDAFDVWFVFCWRGVTATGGSEPPKIEAPASAAPASRPLHRSRLLRLRKSTKAIQPGC